MYALIDCNNFYASCERLFRPDLRDKPILVLSNNDGCVIARSNEVKALGIVMGEPYFKVKELCKRHKVAVFSSNYSLYGDISARVMSVIEREWPQLEIYSIDEAFLDLKTLAEDKIELFCWHLQKIIFKEIGIPTSIGIGQTKTLAKLANHIAKKELRIPVFNLANQREWLKKIEVGEVWGIGRQWHKKLMPYGIRTAHDLANTNAHDLKKQFSVVLQRTAMELQGISCVGLEERSLKKSIMSSKSFGKMQGSYESIAEAISSHCRRAYEKLREQNLEVQNLYVFVQTNRFRTDLTQYHQAMVVKLASPTDDLRVITHHAKACLEKLYKPGFQYKKAGVCFEEVVSKTYKQYDFFTQSNEESTHKTEQLMKVLDAINAKYGSHTMKLAAEGHSQVWAMRSEMRSPCYTTRWSDLPKVKNDT